MKTRLNLLLTQVSRRTMETQKEDLLIDFPKMQEYIDKDEPFVLTTRKHGADLIDRYFPIMEKEGIELTPMNGIKYAKSCLGVDYAFKVYPNNRVEILEVNQHEKWTVQDLIYDFGLFNIESKQVESF